MKKKAIAGICAALLMGSVLTPAALAAGNKTISVTTGIRIYVNDQKLNPTDANGSTVEPFLCNGTTYLPVRAVSNALGRDIQWEGGSRSVYIGSHTSRSLSSTTGQWSVVPASESKSVSVSTGITIYIDDQKLNPKDANGNAVEPFLYNGTTYLPVRAISTALGQNIQWEGISRSVYIGSHSSEAARNALVAEYNARAQQCAAEYENGRQVWMTQSAMNSGSYQCYQNWDALLNDVYQSLHQYLSAGEYQALQAEEIQWIKRRDAEAQAAGAPYAGGSMRPLAVNSKMIELTEKRVYELIAML